MTSAIRFCNSPTQLVVASKVDRVQVQVVEKPFFLYLARKFLNFSFDIDRAGVGCAY